MAAACPLKLVASFNAHLNAADSVLDLATLLGRACRCKEQELLSTRRKTRQAALIDGLETRISGSQPSAWTQTVSNPSKLPVCLGQEIADILAQADTYYPLDCLGVLRGLLKGPLMQLFETFEGQVILDEGMPVPFATRPIIEVIKPKATPYQGTLSSNELLDKCGARLFEYSDQAHVAVCLDFSQRARIDQLGWETRKRLPRIASIHPPRCGDLQATPIGNGQFFDARPTHWSLEAVLDLLKGVVAEVEIAVLPELCLDAPDTLGAALKLAPQEYPALVIAGSGHTRENVGSNEEVRANETRMYLDGVEVGAYRKSKPYEAKELNGEALSEPLLEGLTDEAKTITVLSGDQTRLGVVICADINHLTNPAKLVAAGINLLIVPSFTPQPGSFNGPISDLASLCQGVSMITNAPPSNAELPFHLMVAVPRPAPAEQSDMFPKPGEDSTKVALFDPNKPLDQAVKWR